MQLSEADFHWALNESSNSIAVIVNHLSGNMVSRWTDFLTCDEKNSTETETKNLKLLISQNKN